MKRPLLRGRRWLRLVGGSSSYGIPPLLGLDHAHDPVYRSGLSSFTAMATLVAWHLWHCNRRRNIPSAFRRLTSGTAARARCMVIQAALLAVGQFSLLPANHPMSKASCASII